MMEGKELFTDIEDGQGYYSAHAHLAQMIALLGPPPISLLEHEKKSRKSTFDFMMVILNPEMADYKNAFEYFGGPFFDDNGKFEVH
jgi:hypothetical protein